MTMSPYSRVPSNDIADDWDDVTEVHNDGRVSLESFEYRPFGIYEEALLATSPASTVSSGGGGGGSGGLTPVEARAFGGGLDGCCEDERRGGERGRHNYNSHSLPFDFSRVSWTSSNSCRGGGGYGAGGSVHGRRKCAGNNMNDSSSPRSKPGLLAQLRKHIVVHELSLGQDTSHIPVNLLATLAILQFLCWVLMSCGELILASNPYLMSTDRDGVTFSLLGGVSVMNALMVLYFINGTTDVRLILLTITSTLSFLSMGLLLYLAEDDISIFPTIYHAYKKSVETNTVSEELTKYQDIFMHMKSYSDNESLVFPPTKWVSLEIFKITGAFFGFIVAKLIFSMIFWIKFDITLEQDVKELTEDEEDEDVDSEDEADEELELAQRQRLSQITVPMIVVYLIMGILAYFTTSFINAIAVLDSDLLIYLTWSRLTFSFVMCLVASILLEFRQWPTQSRQLRVLLFTAMATGVSIVYLAVVRNVHTQAKALYSLTEDKNSTTSANDTLISDNSSSSRASPDFCVDKCLLRDLNGTQSHSPQSHCETECIDSHRVCNGIIDFVNSFELFSTGNHSQAWVYVPLGQSGPLLLFPDELYCFFRLQTVFTLNYLIGATAFVVSLALVIETKGLLAYYWRRYKRRRKRLACKRRRRQGAPKEYGATAMKDST